MMLLVTAACVTNIMQCGVICTAVGLIIATTTGWLAGWLVDLFTIYSHAQQSRDHYLQAVRSNNSHNHWLAWAVSPGYDNHHTVLADHWSSTPTISWFKQIITATVEIIMHFNDVSNVLFNDNVNVSLLLCGVLSAVFYNKDWLKEERLIKRKVINLPGNAHTNDSLQ